MSDKRYIERFVSKYASGLKTRYIFKWIIIVGSIGAFLASGVAALALLLPIYYAPHIEIGIIPVSLIVGIIIGIIKTPGKEKATLLIDGFGLKERVTTAFFAKEADCEKSGVSSLQIEDAAKMLREKEREIKLPKVIRRRSCFILLLALSVAVFLALTPSKAKEMAKETHEIKKEAKEEMKEIDEAMEKLSSIDEKTLSEAEKQEIAKMMEQLGASFDEMKNVKTKNDFAAAEQKLQFRYEDIVSSLSEMAEENAEINAENASEMAKTAESIQKNIQGTEVANGENGQNQSGNGNGENGQNQSGNGNGENGQDGQNKSGSGDGENGQNQSGNGNGENGQNQSGNGNGENGQNQGGNEGGEGKGDSDGNSDGSSDKDSDGSGGSGRSDGSSNKEHDYVSIPNETGDDANLNGQKTGDDDSQYAKYENGFGWEGNKTDYGSVMKDYEKRAYEGLESGKYPSGMEEVIKGYFSDFE